MRSFPTVSPGAGDELSGDTTDSNLHNLGGWIWCVPSIHTVG